MSDVSDQPPARPRRWWLAVLLGAAPHLTVLLYLRWPGDVYLTWVEGGDSAQAPYALYSISELYIVPATLLAAILSMAARRTRPWALWLLLGTLGGATAVLVNLALAAVTWRLE